MEFSGKSEASGILGVLALPFEPVGVGSDLLRLEIANEQATNEGYP